RCSETKLKSNPALVSLFILADMDAKVKRVMEIYELSKEDAEDFIFKKDKKRKRYHNYHCSGHWGDSRLYDICINSSCLGIEKTVDYLESYIRARKDI
ncbi:MAG: cytidylate kinase-like family protein, partial [Ruminococcus sp.]|nr:cytidylate kinase-like family protein [Ruminococcus sp.]